MPTADTILNTRQAAELMGAHIETIRRLARKGAIPAFKVGKDWRYRRQALLNWTEKGVRGKNQPNVLVVDDDPAICKQVGRILEPAGWRVITAYNGPDGLRYAHTEPFDFVLLDLKMPGMNGLEFLTQFRKNAPDTPVIIITGYPDSELMIEVMAYTPILLLAKPISKRRLLSSVGVSFGPSHRMRRQDIEPISGRLIRGT